MSEVVENKQMEEMLRGAFVTGNLPAMRRYRHLFGLIPASPRCKLCNAPFTGVGGSVMRLIGRGQFEKNPRYCNACLIDPHTHIGGIELELSMLFVDVRGSTALAENISPSEFSALMNRFYKVATDVLSESDALIDKLVGDEVIGLFVPGFVGGGHPRAAIVAAQKILHGLGYGKGREPWIKAGAAVHTGIAHLGLVGSQGGVNDLTALGDSMNTTARLVSQAASGELVISDATYDAAAIKIDDLEQRTLELKGRTEPVSVRVLNVGQGQAISAA